MTGKQRAMEALKNSLPPNQLLTLCFEQKYCERDKESNNHKE